MKFHHIGIVVTNIEQSLGEIKKYLEFDRISIPTKVGSQKVNVCFLKAGETYIELIDPAENDSPITEFAKKGGGFHHICFEVKNIHEELEKFKEKGARIIVQPVIGFENRLTAFVALNLKNTKCNLIELAQEKF